MELSSQLKPPAEASDPILARVRAAMEEHRLDAIAATSPENVTYLSGAAIPSQLTVRSRLAAAVVPQDGPTALVAIALEGDLCREQSRLDELITYEEFRERPPAVIAEAIRAVAPQPRRIGVETTYVTARDHDEFARELPGAELVPVDELFQHLRMIKQPSEIAAIRRIGQAAERIAREACAQVAPGDTERMLGNVIAEMYGDNGGDRLTMLVVAAGERSAHPNAPPTSRKLEEGDIVRLDIIGTSGGYYSDVARTAVVGEPNELQREIYELLSGVHATAMAALKPGAMTADVYRLYQEAMAEAELPAYHFLGHGLGITLHEEPFIHDLGSVALEPGMVLCIEPLTFLPGRFGIQIEDEVLITDDGCEQITAAGDLLRIGR